MATQWFTPICDQVLAKVNWWQQHYENGEVNATRQFLHPVDGLIDKPTRYAHRLPWTAKQFSELVRLVKAASTNQPLIDELEYIQREKLPRGQLVSGGAHLVTMAFYPEHVQEIFTCLLSIRDGVQPGTLAEQIGEGGLF